MSPPVAALGGNGTSPLDVVRCSVVSVSGHGGIPPCPRTTRLSRGVRGSCGTRPLRPPASLLHNAAFWKVLASRSAKAPLGVAHRFAPLRVSKTGVMQSGLRWSRSHSRRRFPVADTPYAPPSTRPCGSRGTWALVRRCALCFGQWPTASHLVCAPAHPQGLARFAGIGPARSARPPPEGAPSARAPLSLGFATRFVARHARNTGTTGLTACKPAWPLAYFSGHERARGLPFSIIATKTIANYSRV